MTEKTGHFAQFCYKSYAAKVEVIVNKVILFWPDNDKKRGDYQEWRRIGLRMLRPKLLSTLDIFLIFLYYHICSFFFPFLFPGIPGNDSL